MRKLLTRIIGATLGAALALGVGFGINSIKKSEKAEADTGSYTLTFDANTANDGSGTSLTDNDGSTPLTTSNIFTYGTYTFKSGVNHYWLVGGYSDVASVSSTTNCYPGRDSTLKVGKSAGDGTINFTVRGASNLSIDSVVVTAKGSGNTAKITIGEATNETKQWTLSTSSGSHTFAYASAVRTVSLTGGAGLASSNKVAYISQIVINYTVSGAAKYAITYNDTNKTSGSAPTDPNSPYDEGDVVTVLGNTGSLERTGYTWSGWSINQDGSGTAYGPNYTTTYTIAQANVNFYPIWVKNVTPLPESGTISISGTHPNIGSYGTDVEYVVEEDNTPDSEFHFNCTNVTKSTGNLQFKKDSEGILYSTTPLSYIRNVSVVGDSNTDAVITYGKSQNDGCTSNNVGTDNTYFKIVNGASGARYWTITITYSLEAPPALNELRIYSGGESVKKEYDAGDAFDPTGLVIQAKIGENWDTENNVVNQVVWTPNPLTAGTTSVTGTYTYGPNSETVTVNGLTVIAPDVTIDANSNIPAGVLEDTSVTTSGSGQINSTGVTYGYYALAVNEHNDIRNLEFNRDVSNAYLGNNDSYGKFIQKVKLFLTANSFNKFTMYKGNSAIPGSTSVEPSGTGNVRTYDFNNDCEYFALKLTTTGTWVNIAKIEIYLGSVVPEVSSIVASIKNGMYCAGDTLTTDDFNVTASWTGGKADTNPTEGFTWTVNGVENDILSTGNNSIVVTFRGQSSSPIILTVNPQNALNNSSAQSKAYLDCSYNGAMDILDNEFTGVGAVNNYSNWSDKEGSSGVTYIGNSSGNYGSIQVRSSNSSGIATTTAARNGYVPKKVIVKWNENTADEKTLGIYGRNFAYETPAQLYDEGLKGMLLGTIKKGTNDFIEINTAFPYIAIRSEDGQGAIYLDTIKVVWGETGVGFNYSNPSLRFGANISIADWNRINIAWPITDFGVMIAKKSSLGVLSVADAYAADPSNVAICNNGNGTIPYLDGQAWFTVKLNITVNANCATTYCAAPFIVAGGNYYFLDELEYSVNSLATELLTNGGSHLPDDVLTLLANAH